MHYGLCYLQSSWLTAKAETVLGGCSMLTTHPTPEVRPCQSWCHVIVIVSACPLIDTSHWLPLKQTTEPKPLHSACMFYLTTRLQLSLTVRTHSVWLWAQCTQATQHCFLPKKGNSFWNISLPDLRSTYVNMWPHITLQQCYLCHIIILIPPGCGWHTNMTKIHI